MSLPKRVFFTTGLGRHRDELVSFEFALRDAGIGCYNLLPVSSVFPPNCDVVSREEGLRALREGQILHCVLSKFSSREEGKWIYASLGIAIPKRREVSGYFVEYHGYCGAEEDVGKHAEETAAFLLKTAGKELGRKFGVVKKAEVKDHTTVIAAAVFLFE